MGATGTYAVVETYSASGTSKSFKYEVEEATLADPFAGSNPLTLYQYSDVTFTINAITTSTAIIPGPAGGAEATVTGATTNAEYYSLGEPPSGTSTRDIALEFYIYRDDALDADANYFTINSAGPTENDFTYNQVIVATAAAVDNTTSVTLASATDSIVAGMVVTSDSVGIKGTETNVTVSSISGTALVLSSAQAIPVNEELTFSPPLEWDWDILNVVGATAANTTATGSGSAGTTMTISAANDAIKPGMQVAGTNVTGENTVVSVSGTTVELDIAASGTMSGTYNFYGADPTDATKVYVYKITADVEIRKYGTDDLTSQLKVDNFITPSAGSGGGSSVAFLTVQAGANLTSAIIDRRRIDQGDADGTTLSGTGTLTGNWSGNTSSQVTISVSADTQLGTYTGDTNPTFSGTASSDQSGTFNWSIPIDNNSGGAASATDIATGYDVTFAVALVNTP